MKTTKEIEAEIQLVCSKRDAVIKKEVQPLRDELRKLESKRITSIIKNKEYLTDLSEFKGKEITSITALNSQGKDLWLPLDEIIDIDNGKLYLSSLNGGIVQWDVEDRCYVHIYHYSTKKLNIIGFIDIVTDEED